MKNNGKKRSNLIIFNDTVPLSTLIRSKFGSQYFDLLGVRYFRNLFIKANSELFGYSGGQLTFKDLISARIPKEVADEVVMPVTVINVPFNRFLDHVGQEKSSALTESVEQVSETAEVESELVTYVSGPKNGQTEEPNA